MVSKQNFISTFHINTESLVAENASTNLDQYCFLGKITIKKPDIACARQRGMHEYCVTQQSHQFGII